MSLCVCVPVPVCVCIPDRAPVCASRALSLAPTVRWNAFSLLTAFLLHAPQAASASPRPGQQAENIETAKQKKKQTKKNCSVWPSVVCACPHVRFLVVTARKISMTFFFSTSKLYPRAKTWLWASFLCLKTPVTRLCPSCCCDRIRDATVTFALCLCGCLLRSRNSRGLPNERATFAASRVQPPPFISFKVEQLLLQWVFFLPYLQFTDSLYAPISYPPFLHCLSQRLINSSIRLHD